MTLAVYGTDYQARICGSDADVVDYRLTVYPRINEDMIINAYRAAQNADPSTYTFYGVCTAACPSAGAVVCNDNVARTCRPRLDPSPAREVPRHARDARSLTPPPPPHPR